MAISIGGREFISALGGAAAAWTLATNAQQFDRMAPVGILVSLPESDPEGQRWLKALLEGLEKLDSKAGVHR